MVHNPPLGGAGFRNGSAVPIGVAAPKQVTFCRGVCTNTLCGTDQQNAWCRLGQPLSLLDVRLLAVRLLGNSGVVWGSLIPTGHRPFGWRH